MRAASRALGLATADKPAAACLASRLPYGMPVTLGRLSAVDRAEAALRRLGFDELRVRHHDDVARIEVPEHAIDAVVRDREAVVAAVQGAGYRWVTVDLAGLRSGGFNQLLDVTLAEVGVAHRGPGGKGDVGHAEVVDEPPLGS